jgi:hypothetical protein
LHGAAWTASTRSRNRAGSTPSEFRQRGDRRVLDARDRARGRDPEPDGDRDRLVVVEEQRGQPAADPRR